jgi:hypothetical protein
MALDVMPGGVANDRRSVYELDCYTWAQEQARALKGRRPKSLDRNNLAEEVEDLARSERRELERPLEVLTEHLLRWQFQSKRRSRSWTANIAGQRYKIRRRLEQNPGLKPKIPEVLADAYAAARIGFTISALRNAKLSPAESCPWAFEQITDQHLLPE